LSIRSEAEILMSLNVSDSPETNRMDTHKNARLTPRGREDMVRAVVEKGLTKAAAARRFNTSWKTVDKWVRRFLEAGVDGLTDRSSRPSFLPSQTPLATCDAVEVMRRERRIQSHIAIALGLSTATVSRICRARGIGLLSALEPREPRPRYERQAPGELVHLDIKKLGRFDKPGHRVTGDRRGQSNGRGVGWEFAHVAIDDHSRVARIDILPNETKENATLALLNTVAYFGKIGIRIDRVMTDNGSCYRSKLFAAACRRLEIKHIRTKPYTPQTNGKAERFVQTSLREWAYAEAYQNSEQRKNRLETWLHHYNHHRPHAGIGKATPISRIGLNRNNLLQIHI
jgi:transposase InsO family protein